MEALPVEYVKQTRKHIVGLYPKGGIGLHPI